MGSCNCSRCLRLHDACFPCNCCKPCCPQRLQVCFSLQDWLHLILLLGVVSSLVAASLKAHEMISTQAAQCEAPFCARQIITLIFLIPSNIMFVQMICEYDAGSLANAEQKLEQELRQLTEDTVRSLQLAAAHMEVVIRELSSSAVQQASRLFREHAEIFQKFLKDTLSKEDLFTDQESVQEFKRFVQKWFDMFALSLLDPQIFTKALVEEKSLVQALDECNTLKQISDVCQPWLKLVSSITLESRTMQLQNTAQSIMLMDAEGRSAGPSAEAEVLAGYARSVFGTSEGSEISALALDPNRLRCGISWIHFGCTGVGMKDSELPATFQCCILTLKVLSARHVLFLAMLFSNLLFIGFEIVILKPFLLALFVINEVCVISVLICFDQIDATQRAKQLAERTSRKKAKLEAKFEQARQEWDTLQGRLDLWNFRTFPSLSLLNKLQIAMGISMGSRDQPDPLVRVHWMRTINDEISNIDAYLEQVDWTSRDEAASRQRRQIGAAFDRYIQEVFSAGVQTTLQDVLGHLALEKLQLALGPLEPSPGHLAQAPVALPVAPPAVPVQSVEQPEVQPAPLQPTTFGQPDAEWGKGSLHLHQGNISIGHSTYYAPMHTYAICFRMLQMFASRCRQATTLRCKTPRVLGPRHRMR